MSERSPEVLIRDILDSIRSIKSYTEGISQQDFENDPKTKDAVVMHFIVIGEASNRLPESFKNGHAHIPWNEIRGLRNRIAHDYFGVDYGIVWDIVQENLDYLSQQLSEII